MPTRRTFCSLVTTGLIASTQSGSAEETHPARHTAREIIDMIKQHVGVPWREQTVDVIKAGDPETPIMGIATTMMGTYDVLQRAAADGKNFVISHEPVFYTHLDSTDALRKENDAVWAQKEQFIRDHKMVIWRFHDHWHMRRPDGILQGMTAALGWEKYQHADRPALFTLPSTSLEQLAASIRDRLKIRTLRVVGQKDLQVTKVAFLPGAGGWQSHRPMLQRDDVEVLVIGEVPEWETILYVSDAVAEGRKKALILMGHIPSEQAGMENCAAWLKTFIQDTPISFIAAAEPFWMPR